MTDNSKVQEHELKMKANLEGYRKIANAFVNSLSGIITSFTKEEWHQAIVYKKELEKKYIEESDCSEIEKEQRKLNVEMTWSALEDLLKNHCSLKNE